MSCAGYIRTNQFSKDSNISLHQFPLANKDLCQKWIIATKRDKFIPTKSSYLCSSHLSPEDYTTTHHISCRLQLSKNAVKPAFSCLERFLSKRGKRKSPSTKSSDTGFTFDERPSKKFKDDVSTDEYFEDEPPSFE